jgi:hypothetical protein
MEWTADHGGGTSYALRVTDRRTGLPPDAATIGYRVEASHSEPGTRSIQFDTRDVRDVVALAIACRNQLHVEHGEPCPDEDTFSPVGSGMTVHNAFADAQYGDWRTVSSDEGGIVLAKPTDGWGDGYLEWRNARTDAILAPAAPAPGAR